jgi:hypothetical protein
LRAAEPLLLTTPPGCENVCDGVNGGRARGRPARCRCSTPTWCAPRRGGVAGLPRPFRHASCEETTPYRKEVKQARQPDCNRLSCRRFTDTTPIPPPEAPNSRRRDLLGPIGCRDETGAGKKSRTGKLSCLFQHLGPILLRALRPLVDGGLTATKFAEQPRLKGSGYSSPTPAVLRARASDSPSRATPSSSAPRSTTHRRPSRLQSASNPRCA